MDETFAAMAGPLRKLVKSLEHVVVFGPQFKATDLPEGCTVSYEKLIAGVKDSDIVDAAQVGEFESSRRFVLRCWCGGNLGEALLTRLHN